MGIANRFVMLGGAFALAVLATISSAPVAYGAEQAEPRAIEEILVTSRRIEESEQDVPVAVTAFSTEAIDQIAPRTLRDFDGLMPNVRIGMNTAGPSAGAIYIRGIGYADIEKTQAPAVAVIIDGVQQGSNTGQLIDAYDVAQLEVNRGPQGVLQGKNTTGGSIVVTRYRPQFNEWGWLASVQGGDYDEQQAKGRLNIPLMEDHLALKIAGITKKQDGYYDNPTKGCNECAGDIKYDAATAALLWEPLDSFSALLTYDYIHDRGDIPPQDPRWNGFDPFTNWANLNESQKYDVDTYSLNLDWQLPFGTITSITAYQDTEDKVWQDFDGDTRLTPASPLVQLHTRRDASYDIFSQELKLIGDLPLVENVTYTVGGFYWDSELKHSQGTNQVLQFPPAIWDLTLGLPSGSVTPGCTLFGGFVPSPLVPNLNPSIGDSQCQLGPLWADQHSSEDVKSTAGFFALTWNITPDIEVSGGARYIKEDKDFKTQFGDGFPASGPVDSYGDPINPPSDPGGNTPQCITDPLTGVNVNPPCTYAGFPIKDDDSWDDWIFKLSGSWHVTDDNLVYASYSEGYRSGGYSIRATDPNRLTFDNEDSSQWEIGSKNDLFDGRVRVNLTAFYMELNDPQGSSILQQDAPPGTNTLILNGNKIKSYGAELSTTWAATEHFTLQAILGLQNVDNEENSQSCLDVVFNPNGYPCNPVDNPGLDFSNPASLPAVEFEKSPGFLATDYNYAISGLWEYPMGPGVLSANVIAKVTDDVQIASVGGDPIIEPGYTLWDARIAYEWVMANDETLTFEVIGKNLNDEEYRQEELPLGAGGGFRGWGPPLTWAVAVTWAH